MKLSLHINFDGRCEEAFAFYADNLGGVIGHIFRYSDSPKTQPAHENWQHKILHGNISIANIDITGADISPEQYKVPQGFSLRLALASAEKTQSVFELLKEEGTVSMPLQKTFWSPCYGVVVDKFGVSWELNCAVGAKHD